MPNLLFIYIVNICDLVWFGLVLLHINPCRLFDAKSSFYIYSKYIWFGLVWYGLVLLHINPCRLFNAKSSFYIYSKYIWFGLVWFGLVWFYCISTLVDYLMPNLLFTYIVNICDLVWFGLVLLHINPCRLFNAKSSFYIYSKYIWFALVWFGFIAYQRL